VVVVFRRGGHGVFLIFGNCPASLSRGVDACPSAGCASDARRSLACASLFEGRMGMG